MLRPNIQLRTSQSLSLTPQLQQTIRLLHFSTLELQSEVLSMLEQNPMLEVDESAANANEQAPAAENAPTAEASEAEAQTAPETVELTDMESKETLPDELPLDTQWDEVYEPSTIPGSAPLNNATSDFNSFLENQEGGSPGLQDHLVEQLRLSNLSPNDLRIAAAIVLSINESGYLSESLESIHEMLQDEIEGIELDEVVAVQHYIMRLHPIGCGARNLQENLLAQLPLCNGRQATIANATLLVEKHLELLSKQDLVKLKRASGLSEDEIIEAMDLIRSLNPRPGSQVSEERIDYITPDVYVSQVDGVWGVSLNPDVAPRLQVHSYYSSLIKRGDKSDTNRYLRDQLQEARWFIKSLQSRNETILKVAEVIVARQQAYFNEGPEAMTPMVLRDIAEELGMHESTISRVTTQKYMLTPKGMVEFKYFFSSQVSTSDGGNASATAIRAMIQSLIQDENPQKPLSDSKITTILLNDKGVKVARRTVAKYREAMQIPPSNERKRIA